MLNTVEFLK